MTASRRPRRLSTPLVLFAALSLGRTAAGFLLSPPGRSTAAVPRRFGARTADAATTDDAAGLKKKIEEAMTEAVDAAEGARLKKKIDEATAEAADETDGARLKKKIDEADEEAAGSARKSLYDSMYALPGRKKKKGRSVKSRPKNGIAATTPKISDDVDSEKTSEPASSSASMAPTNSSSASIAPTNSSSASILPTNTSSSEEIVPTMHLSSLGRLEIASNASLPLSASLVLEDGDKDVTPPAASEQSSKEAIVVDPKGIISAVKNSYDDEIKILEEEMLQAYQRRSNEMAQAFSEHMVKSHEEKLRIVAELKREHAAELRALRREIASLNAAASAREGALSEAREDAASARRALESYKNETRAERTAAVAEAERIITEKYERLLDAERRAASEAVAEAERKITEKYEKLLKERVAAAAVPPVKPVAVPPSRTVEESIESQKKKEVLSRSSRPKQWWE